MSKSNTEIMRRQEELRRCAEAIGKILNILIELPPEQRYRVLRAAAILYGLELETPHSRT